MRVMYATIDVISHKKNITEEGPPRFVQLARLAFERREIDIVAQIEIKKQEDKAGGLLRTGSMIINMTNLNFVPKVMHSRGWLQ